LLGRVTNSISFLEQSPEIGNAVIPVVPVGQVLIPSGKFEKPVKVPGKTNFKDEVVIRNADSGKGKIDFIMKNKFSTSCMHAGANRIKTSTITQDSS